MKSLLFVIPFGFFFYVHQGCKPKGPQPEDLVGTYLVKIQTDTLHDENVPLHEANDDFEMNADSIVLNFEKSVEHMGNEFDTNMDTSQIEGELEHSIQMFGKTIENFGKGMENFAESLGDFGEQIASKSKKWKNQLLENIQFEVELQQDGDCKIKSLDVDFLNLRDAKWEVKQDSFYVLRSDQTPLSFYVEKIEKNRIYLKKEDITVVMTRKE